MDRKLAAILAADVVGYASLMERDYTLGMDTALAVLTALVALMAGLMFGSVLVPPRRFL